MRARPRVYVIGEDIGAGLPFGVTKGLREEFGADRILDAPISEAAIVGSAVGAAMTGMRAGRGHALRRLRDLRDGRGRQPARQDAATCSAASAAFPLTLRMPYGIGKSAGGHHSNSVEAWFLNTPGLKLCLPSTPADALGLLKTAIRDDDPVLVFEQRSLYRCIRARAGRRSTWSRSAARRSGARAATSR